MIITQTIEESDQAAGTSLCKLYVPGFYELGSVEAGSAFYLEGPKKPISDFFNNPMLILLDGTESRLWQAEDLNVRAGENDFFPPGEPWPDVATVTLYIRFKGVGQPLAGRPWQLSSALQNFIGISAYGENYGNLERRFLLATTAKNLAETTSSQPEKDGLLEKLAIFFQQPPYYLHNCLAIEKLRKQEFQPETNWQKDNLFGLPVLISSHFSLASLTQIKHILAGLNEKLPFGEFIKTKMKSDLSIVFIKEYEHSRTIAPGYFDSYLDHSRIMVWILEDEPVSDTVQEILVHEFYHALSSAWNNKKVLYKTNENISLEESSAEWFAFFCGGKGTGLKYDKESFQPGSISIWPASAACKSNRLHYNLSTFIHWLYLKINVDSVSFLEKVLKSSREGKFRHLLEDAGYASMNQALPEYMAFCWWMSLGSPEYFDKPFNASFANLQKKSFFVADSKHNFNSIAWEVEKLEYWKFFPEPGHSYFLKGRIESLKSGWELVSKIPEDKLMIFMAFMADGKILESRRLKGFSELDIIRKQLPAKADNWSMWVHYQLPENEDIEVSEDDQKNEPIMEMFKSGQKSARGTP